MATRQQALEQRTAAARSVMDIARQLPVAVGITPHKDGWAVKVSLRRMPENVAFPASVGGVPTVIEASGPIDLLGRRRKHGT